MFDPLNPTPYSLLIFLLSAKSGWEKSYPPTEYVGMDVGEI